MTPRKPKKAEVVLRYVVAVDGRIMAGSLSYTAQGARYWAIEMFREPWAKLYRKGYRVIRVEVREVEK